MADAPEPEGDADRARLAGRLDEYRQLWERAAHRLVHEEYHAEDLVDDWFTLWGKIVRDTTALTAVTWQAANTTARRQAEANNGNGERPAPAGGDDGG